MTNTKHAFTLCLLWVGLTGMISVDAAVFGYWRFEEGTSGAVIVTAPSEVNTSNMNATQGTGNDIAVKYSSEVGGNFVYDPVLQTYTENTRSMHMPIGGDVGGANANSSLTAANSQGSVLTQSPGDWTFETFVKIQDADGNLGGGNIASVTGNSRWTPAFYADGRLRFRVHTADESGSVITGSGDNILDGEWHHLAYTIDFDSDANETTLSAYLDYDTPVTQTIAGQFAPYPFSDLNFGRLDGSDGDYNWFFDETRLSNTALSSNQFLRLVTIPEPSTLSLLIFGALAATACRHRNQCKRFPIDRR